jgi:hypothetical protein
MVVMSCLSSQYIAEKDRNLRQLQYDLDWFDPGLRLCFKWKEAGLARWVGDSI